MLRNVSQLQGYKLGAEDGEIGHVNELYFDDKDWVVRYLVADTGSWLTGRKVLISPCALGDMDDKELLLFVKLTRKSVENSPSIDKHKPISRHVEKELLRYHGWPLYWMGGDVWGPNNFPMFMPVELLPDQPRSDVDESKEDDSHLRSTHDVIGHHIQARDGEVGHVTDFVVDDKNWAIRHLIVDTGHWLSGKKVLISPDQIERISWEESKVFVNLSREAIVQAPEAEHDPLIFQT